MTIRELSRRRFLKSASGLLLVPSFDILVPKLRATNFLARPAAGGGGCDTIRDTNSFSGDNLALGNENSYTTEFAFKFTAGATYTACSAKVSLKKVGSPTFNIRARISEGATRAGTSINSGTNVGAATLAATYGLITFPGLSKAIASATTYWLHLEADAIGDASNYVHISIGLGGGGIDWDFNANDMFSEYDANAGSVFEIYSA